MYKTDPTKGLGLTPEQEKRVLGGEACEWAETVDPVNVDVMALSRTVAVAERLWSAVDVTDPDNLEVRSQRFRCLMVRRGISGAGPLSSDYCEVKWPFPKLDATTPTIQVQNHQQNPTFSQTSIILSAGVGCIAAAFIAVATFFIVHRK